MMKKLAVTVFALSLTAIGCGSDDGGKKDAARLDAPPGVEVQPQTDTPITPTDVPISGPEVQADTPADQPSAVEVQSPVEAHPVEAGIDSKPIDVPAVDSATPDAPIKIDGGTLDTQPTEAAKPIDAGLDSGSVG